MKPAALRTPRRIALATLLAVTASCASSSVYVHAFNPRDQQGAFYLPFNRGAVTSFSNDDGRPCPMASAFVLGWESEHAPCSHDTHYDGVRPAEMTLSWTGVVPKDGDFEIDTFDNGLRVWVDAVSRGGWNTDSITDIKIFLQARSDHCSLNWMDSVTHVASFGPEVRDTYYGGFKEVPTLRLVNCKAGDALEVRVGLAAEANRGFVLVDSFGFRAANANDANHVVGLVFRKPGEGVTAMQRSVCSQVQGGMCTHVEIVQDNLHGDARGHPSPTMTPNGRPR